jgi:TfoX/Sxy family transcriptional regulator of competence genes
MAYSEALAERIRTALGRRKNVIEKRMFGGIGFLLNGNLCVGVSKEDLLVRFNPDDAAEAMKEPHVKEFGMQGRAMKGWLKVGPEGVQDDSALGAWVKRALSYVETLPPK